MSQVDFKFKSNETKTKLRKLCKGIDSEKSGMLAYEVFFDLLSLHKILLSNSAISILKKNYSKNQTINYKEAINQLTIDLDVAGRVLEDGEVGLGA